MEIAVFVYINPDKKIYNKKNFYNIFLAVEFVFIG